MRRWLVVVIAVGLVAGCGGESSKTDPIATSTTASGTTTAPEPTTTAAPKITEAQRLAAFDACKTFVKRKLNAPSTAKFRDFFGDQAPLVTSTDGKTFDVSSSVDAENAFGAELRSNFDCSITGTKDTWTLVFLNIVGP